MVSTANLHPYIEVRLLGPAGSVDADVADFGDGTYGLSFTVPRAGDWRVQLAVNGEENPNPIARLKVRRCKLDPSLKAT